jgi:ATP-dependent Clp protease ATP-binding subunit ClpA
MFERFTEIARQALFFAYDIAGERNGAEIDTPDLLGGLMLAEPNAVLRFCSSDAENLRPAETGEQRLMRQREKFMAGAVQTAQEIPFSSNVILALQRAVQEADDLGQYFIRPEHLVLGLLREENTAESQTLRKAGVTLQEVRRVLRAEPDVPAEDVEGGV